MFSPAQTTAHLHLDEAAVLDLVNTGRLSCLQPCGSIRFKITDVLMVAELLVAA